MIVEYAPVLRPLLTLQPKAKGACFVVRKNHVRTDVMVHNDQHTHKFQARRVPSLDVLAEAVSLDELLKDLEGKI